MMAAPYRECAAPLAAFGIEVERDTTVSRLLRTGSFELIPVSDVRSGLPQLEDASLLSVGAGKYAVALADADDDEPFHEVLARYAQFGIGPAPIHLAVAFAAAWTGRPGERSFSRLCRARPVRRNEPALLGWVRDFPCEGRTFRGGPCGFVPGPPFATLVDGDRRWLLLAARSSP